jgi:hypothetical protein
LVFLQLNRWLLVAVSLEQKPNGEIPEDGPLPADIHVVKVNFPKGTFFLVER